MPLRNKATVPQGMLAPSGNVETFVNPAVQETTRPAGSLLAPSPGFDSVRVGKNRFQGKGPSGGFRRMEFAEDVGGTGAALSVVPGETSLVEASEWLPEPSDPVEGSVIIADREHKPGWASVLHQGRFSLADMGDRNPNRPRSNRFRSLNPARFLREDYQESPAIAVAMGIGLVYVVYLLASEGERQYRSYRPRGVGSRVADVPASGASASGEVTGDAIDKIGKAADNAVTAIEGATDKAVSAIEDTAKSAKQTATGD